MSCVQTFDSFCFQNVLKYGDGDSKNDTGQLTNQLSRIYIGVIKFHILYETFGSAVTCK